MLFSSNTSLLYFWHHCWLCSSSSTDVHLIVLVPNVIDHLLFSYWWIAVKGLLLPLILNKTQQQNDLSTSCWSDPNPDPIKSSLTPRRRAHRPTAPPLPLDPTEPDRAQSRSAAMEITWRRYGSGTENSQTICWQWLESQTTKHLAARDTQHSQYLWNQSHAVSNTRINRLLNHKQTESIITF